MRKRLLCVSGGASSVCFEGAEVWESVDVGGRLPQPTLRGSHSGFAISKLRCRLRLRLPLSTIRHLRWRVCASLRHLRWRRRRRWWGYFVDFFVGRRGAFFVVARRAEALDALASSATMARQSCRLSALASLSLGIL